MIQMNKKKYVILFWLTLLILSGCTVCEKFLYYESRDGVTETKDDVEEKEYEAEIVQRDKELEKRKIPISPQQMQGNIVGYSFIRMPPNLSVMYYAQDLPYLLDEAVVGKGVFISEYMCETEVFIGKVLNEVLTKRGRISNESREYFTDWALQQLKEIDWSRLETDWKIDSYAYDRYYQLNTMFGEVHYNFDYSFYANREKMKAEKANMVEVACLIDNNGKIYEIQIDIIELPMEQMGMEKFISTMGLFDNTYRESVISNGYSSEGKIVLDFEKYYRRFLYPDEQYEQNNRELLISGDAALSAEKIGKILIDILETKGVGIERYEKFFSSYLNSDFEKLKNKEWNWLEENWRADVGYDCFFIDNIRDSGFVGFQYYFYPDYDAMNIDVAKAILVDCKVDVSEGKLTYIDMKAFPMKKEAYKEAKKIKEKGKQMLIKNGNALSEKEMVTVPLPKQQLNFVPIKEFQMDTSIDNYKRNKEYSIWGFSNGVELAEFLGKKFYRDIQEKNIENGEIMKLCTNEEQRTSFLDNMKFSEEWKINKNYDCYYIRQNEVAGCVHLQYYFYFQKHNEKQKKVMIMDVYVSEYGIESIQFNESKTDLGRAFLSIYEKELENQSEIIAKEKDIENESKIIINEKIYYTKLQHLDERIESNITYEGINTYASVLAEYEQIWENVTVEDCENAGIDETIIRYLGNERYSLGYSLVDLTGDGTAELIIAIGEEGVYTPRKIYAYDKGMVLEVAGIMERPLVLYEQGIIEEIWGAGGRAYYTYYRMQKDSSLIDFVAEVSCGGIGEEDGKFYQRIGKSINEETEITEKVFREIIEKYETTPIELEWKSLDGFNQVD